MNRAPLTGQANLQLRLKLGTRGRKVQLDADAVRRLFLEGMSPIDIGKVLGCTERPVIRTLRELGVPGRSLSQAAKASHNFWRGRRPIFSSGPRKLLDYTIDLQPVELGYLAGLIDGEGSIDKLKAGLLYRLTVSNTNKDIINWLVAQLHCGHIDVRRREQYKPCWVWYETTTVPVYRILVAVRPYLIAKTAKAEEAIRVLSEAISRLPRAEKSS